MRYKLKKNINWAKVRYKLKKNINWAKEGTIFDHNKTEGTTWICLVEGKSLWYIQDLITAIWIDNKEWFEKVEESPKYKIWDYAVRRHNSAWEIEFIKIINIRVNCDDENETEYNYTTAEYLRKPTQEELEKYYR